MVVSAHGVMDRGSILHGGPIELFLIPGNDWYNKRYGMCYAVCEMVHIKDPLLLIKKSSSCSGGIRFPLLLSESSLAYSQCYITVNKIC